MLFTLALPLDDESQTVWVQKGSSCRSRVKPESSSVASELHGSRLFNVDVFSSSESSKESEVNCRPVTRLFARNQKKGTLMGLQMGIGMTLLMLCL